MGLLVKTLSSKNAPFRIAKKDIEVYVFRRDYNPDNPNAPLCKSPYNEFDWDLGKTYTTNLYWQYSPTLDNIIIEEGFHSFARLVDAVGAAAAYNVEHSLEPLPKIAVFQARIPAGSKYRKGQIIRCSRTANGKQGYVSQSLELVKIIMVFQIFYLKL